MQNVNNNLKGLEPAVKSYQETGDERFFELILNTYRGYIQGRAFNTANKYGLDETDCESVLCTSLWKATKKYDTENGVPFDAFVSLIFAQDLKHFFSKQKTKKDRFSRPDSHLIDDTEDSSSVKLVYYLAEENWDIPDFDPKADVENLVVDEDAANSLLQSIREFDNTCADVVALTACGYSQRNIAKVLGYNPEGVGSDAPNLWVIWRLKKSIKPTEMHYEKMGMPIPIHLKK